MTELTAQNVHDLMLSCLYPTGTEHEFVFSHGLRVEGVMNTVYFDPARIEAEKETIKGLLDQLLPDFRPGRGAGGHFLSLPLREADREIWGQHEDAERLMMLALAAGWMRYALPRVMWTESAGVPVLAVSDPPWTDDPSRTLIEAELLHHLTKNAHERQQAADAADTSGETVTVDTGTCAFCGQGGSVQMPREAFMAYDGGRGAPVQRAWPQGSAGEREQLISGTHPTCFDAAFPEEV